MELKIRPLIIPVIICSLIRYIFEESGMADPFLHYIFGMITTAVILLIGLYDGGKPK